MITVDNHTLDFTETETNVSDNTEQQVAITVEPFRRSWKTSITGIDWTRDRSVSSDKELLKKWKKKLSCNGHLDVEDGKMTFQGDHNQTIYGWVIKLGYSPDQIIVAGTGK
jgi:translation initiation factor 1 (eIF-1/SUI1)